MSKKETKEIVKEKSNKEIIENLQVQLKDYREKAEHFRVMSIKAEGAIGVLSQLEKDKDGNVRDSLVTVGQGAGGVALSFWEVLPDILRMLILLATLAHITVKLIKDFNK